MITKKKIKASELMKSEIVAKGEKILFNADAYQFWGQQIPAFQKLQAKL